MGRCRRHPHHIVVGVCAYCLNEQLCALLETQGDVYAYDRFAHQYVHSPLAFTSSNISTSCATMPESPSAEARQTPPQCGLSDHSADSDLSPKASSHQCFSLSCSPKNRLRSDSFVQSFDVCSPQNQVFLGNHDFIKGEIPRKKKTTFWSFLQRHKPGFYKSCGAAYLRRNDSLDEDAVCDSMDYRNHARVHQQIKEKMHKVVYSTVTDKHLNGEKHRLHRYGVLKDAPRSQENPAVWQGYLTQSWAVGNDCQNGDHPNKQSYSSSVTPGCKPIGLSPLRHERHVRNDNDEVFSNGLRSVYAAESIRRYDQYVNKEHPGLSSSWNSSTFPGKIHRSKSSSGFSDASNSGPTMAETSLSSPDRMATTRARSASCLSGEAIGSPKYCLPVTGNPEYNLLMKVYDRSPKNHRQDVFTSPSIFSRSRPTSGAVECRKASTKVSPLILAAQKKSSSPHGLFTDEYRSTSRRHCDYPAMFRGRDGCYGNGSMKRYVSPHAGIEKYSQAVMAASDDECREGPGLFDLNLSKSMQKKGSLRKMKERQCSKTDRQSKEAGDGSQVFASTTARSWSKALGSMLGMRRGNKQAHRTQAMPQLDQIQHQMKKMRDTDHHLYNAESAFCNYDSDFIDYEQNDLYYLHHPDNAVPGNCDRINGYGMQEKGAQVVPDLQDKGPPQQYSFLSRDYSAFSCYFSPQPQSFESADMAASRHSISHKLMQADNESGSVRKANHSALLPAMAPIRGIILPSI